ncbi:MAG: hypothetical protein IPH74_15045 [Bacteroidetes bacterium]|nr:hypothetical protein [Bacteroidota bacterium]
MHLSNNVISADLIGLPVFLSNTWIFTLAGAFSKGIFTKIVCPGFAFFVDSQTEEFVI